MIKFIFKTGDTYDKLEKCRIIDNMRTEIDIKARQGILFSNDAIIALSYFPKSDLITFFGIERNIIVKGVKPNQAYSQNWENSGYGDAYFCENGEWVCYYIADKELELIGWTDAAIVPDFVTEVFTKLDCMPDEIVNE